MQKNGEWNRKTICILFVASLFCFQKAQPSNTQRTRVLSYCSTPYRSIERLQHGDQQAPHQLKAVACGVQMSSVRAIQAQLDATNRKQDGLTFPTPRDTLGGEPAALQPHTDSRSGAALLLPGTSARSSLNWEASEAVQLVLRVVLHQKHASHRPFSSLAVAAVVRCARLEARGARQALEAFAVVICAAAVLLATPRLFASRSP